MMPDRPVNLDGPPTDDGDAIQALIKAGVPVNKLADFVQASQSSQEVVVKKAGGSVALYRALLAANEPPLTAFHKTLLVKKG